jgi:hypothetical protein
MKDMRKLISINLMVLMSMVLVACASAATPVAPASSASVNIAVETNPDPMVPGDVELTFTIADESGTPVEGATVDVDAAHTGHGGMEMTGAATDQGGGKYAITANFSMSGDWKITVHVRKEGLDYKEEIEMPVQ